MKKKISIVIYILILKFKSDIILNIKIFVIKLLIKKKYNIYHKKYII